MARPTQIDDPPLGMGLTSVVLGAVGLLVFFMPILGIPLGAVGLAFGLASFVLAVFGWTSLRWSLGGIVLSGIALVVGIVLAQSAAGPLPTRTAPGGTPSAAGWPYVPPPARPGVISDDEPATPATPAPLKGR